MNSNKNKRKTINVSNKLRNLISTKSSHKKKSPLLKFKTPIRRKKNSLSTIALSKKRISDKSIKATSKPKRNKKTPKQLLENLSNIRQQRRKKNFSFIQKVKVRKGARSRTKTKSFAYPSRSCNKENSYIVNDTISNNSLISENLKCLESILKSHAKKKNRKRVPSVPNSSSSFSVRLRKIDSNHSNAKSAHKTHSPMSIDHKFETILKRKKTMKEEKIVQKKKDDNFGDYFKGNNVTKKEVTKLMRAILINWMGEVAENFYFKRGTLHLAVSYLDKYLYLTSVQINRQKFQLLGIVAMFIASKFEETEVGSLNDYLALAKNIYSKEQMLKLEREMLITLNFKIWNDNLDNYLNEYTAMWDEYLAKSNYEGEKSLLYFRLPYKDSYKSFCYASQLIDCVILDPEHLCYCKKLLSLSVIYIVVMFLAEEYSKEEIVEYFPIRSKYLMNWTEPLNSTFRDFLRGCTEYNAVELLPNIQFCSKFFGFKVNQESPRILKNGKGAVLRSSYEQFLSYYKMNESCLEIVRKKSNLS